MNSNRIESIDGLRGVAAVVIAFFWHYNHFTGYPPLLMVFYPLYYYGEAMTELFFLISGFTIALVYQDRIIRGCSFSRFICKRLKSFYFLYLLSMVITCVEQMQYKAISGETFIYNSIDYIHVLLGILLQLPGFLFCDIPANGPTWYLSILLYLYIVFYYVVKLFSKNDSFLMIVYAVISFCGIFLFMPYSLAMPFINLYSSRGIICFFWGCALCCAHNYYKKNKHKNIYFEKSYLFAIIILIFTLFILFKFNLLTKQHRIISRLIEMYLFFPAVLVLAIELKPFNVLLSSKPFAFLGKLSLYIFLFHFPVQLVIKIIEMAYDLDIDYGSPLVWLIYCGLVFVVSMLARRLDLYILNKKVIL